MSSNAFPLLVYNIALLIYIVNSFFIDSQYYFLDFLSAPCFNKPKEVNYE
nr:MAG TPA: hypothetical protein [Caudoviricetes sp.]